MAALLIIREEHVTGHFVLMENQTNADNRMDIVPSLNGSMFFFGRAGRPQQEQEALYACIAREQVFTFQLTACQDNKKHLCEKY